MGRRNPNIILIVIDALRAHNVTCYGYDKPTTLNICRIAERGVLFENAFSTTNATDPSLTSILSGFHPCTHGVVSHGELVDAAMVRLAQQVVYISQLLKRIGYRTLAIDWLGRWHRKGFDYYSGFLVKRSKLFLRIRSLLGLSSPLMIDDAKTILDVAISLLRDRVYQPKFMFIHFWNTHAPYFAPREYIERFSKYEYGTDLTIEDLMNKFASKKARKYIKARTFNTRNIDEVLRRYDASIAYTDEQIGKLMEFLETEGLIDNTYIIITSDHGESLLEHEIFFDHHGLYDVSIRVPLIITGPEIPSGLRVNHLVQHVDIVPTILEILGANINKGIFDGISLLKLLRSDREHEWRSFIVAVEGYAEKKVAIRTRYFKYIYSEPAYALCRFCGKIHGGVEEFYDLRHDPFEEKNLMVYEKDIVSEGLRELARAFFIKCFKENPAIKMVRLRTKHGLVNKLLDRIKPSEW